MSKQTTVKDFFAPVNERRYRLNVQLNMENDFDKQNHEHEQKESSRKRTLNDFEELKQVALSRTGSGASSNNSNETVETVESVKETIDNIIMEDFIESSEEIQEKKMQKLFEIGPDRKKKTKPWSNRPDNWHIIADHLIQYNYASTIAALMSRI
jgi:hypothetical protein